MYAMKKLLILFLVVSCSTQTYANEIYFQNYGLREGLSSNLVFGIAEDRDGALWLATVTGIDKFDGLNFKHYELPDITINGISDYMNTYISSDSKGNIWAATRSGLVYKYSLDKDQFEMAYKFVNPENPTARVFVHSFYFDNRDKILVSLTYGLSILDTDTFEEVILTSNPSIYKISQDSKNNYYFSDNNKIKIWSPPFEEIQTSYPEELWQFQGLAGRGIKPFSDHELI